MSAVSPGALVIFCFRYLPRPSWVMPRWTLTPSFGHVGELDRVVLARPDRLGEVLADLLGVDVEGGDELDVADVVAAEVDVHQAGDLLGRVGVLVVLDALDEGVGAVADADDRDADLVVACGRRRCCRLLRCSLLMKFEVLLGFACEAAQWDTRAASLVTAPVSRIRRVSGFRRSLVLAARARPAGRR